MNAYVAFAIGIFAGVFFGVVVGGLNKSAKTVHGPKPDYPEKLAGMGQG